jgi:nucleoside-diphosphate-sugar epimerase
MQSPQAETYLVTGGAGFIGSHMVDALLHEGHKVRVVDNFLTGKRENIAHVVSQIDLREISITDLDALQRAMEGVDYVFHFAALPSVPRSVKAPLDSNDNNVNGTLNVLIAARDNGIKRVVNVGSSSAYGNVDAPFKSEDMLPRPRSPYAASKLAAEHYSQAFYHVYGLETVTVRYFNVFGPRQDPLSAYAAVIPKFISAMLKGDPPPVEGDGFLHAILHTLIMLCMVICWLATLKVLQGRRSTLPVAEISICWI